MPASDPVPNNASTLELLLNIASALALLLAPQVGQVEGMVPLPASYYGFLAATVLAYAVTVQLAKLAYIRAFKSWL